MSTLVARGVLDSQLNYIRHGEIDSSITYEILEAYNYGEVLSPLMLIMLSPENEFS
jgi:hypothetical protein